LTSCYAWSVLASQGIGGFKMGAAFSVLLLLSVSVFVIRIAAVALRITGLTEETARFQALSAFSGTGFTTTEAENIVNYPVRRRIVGILMIIGNIGIVGVLATLVASMVHTDGDINAVLKQLAWILGGLALLWFLMLNAAADRILCGLIARVLKSTTTLGEQRFTRLVQIGPGYSVCEHPIRALTSHQTTLDLDALKQAGAQILALRSTDGSVTPMANATRELKYKEDDVLVLFSSDEHHLALSAV